MRLLCIIPVDPSRHLTVDRIVCGSSEEAEEVRYIVAALELPGGTGRYVEHLVPRLRRVHRRED